MTHESAGSGTHEQATQDAHEFPLNSAYVAMGANLGNPAQQMQQAAQLLAELGEVVVKSSLYRTPPMGPAGQPDYLNAVLVLKPPSVFEDPRQLLRQLLDIELHLGRVRRERWGPRTIDLDLIDYGGRTVTAAEGTSAGEGKDLPSIRLPHPEIHQRSFVLVPLNEVNPNWQHPVLGKTVGQLLAHVDQGGIEMLPGAW